MQRHVMQAESSETSTGPAFNAIVVSVDAAKLVLKLPRTNYQLHLAAPPKGSDTFTPGQHVRGFIRGASLRMYAAQGGGKFIEPIWGEPRIITATVLNADETAREVIVDAAAVFVLKVPADQKFDILVPGALVNFYLKSGAQFVPVE